jgi:hypothetical protein
MRALVRLVRRAGRVRRDQAGQALALVSGLMLVLTLGGAILVQNFGQQAPIVLNDLIQHQAYRAVQAGLDEYLYKANINADYVICDSANETTGFCPGLNFQSWTAVQGTTGSNGPPSWFYINNPTLNYSTGTVSLVVEGAAGYPHDYGSNYSYDSATITLQPLNNFLLDLLWLNYNQIDPVVISANDPPTCGYYYDVGLESRCEAVDLITGDSLNGNIYVNDSIFTCGNPSFSSVATADPNEIFVKTCAGTPTVSGTETDGAPTETIPQDDSQLTLIAQEGGCLYEGPTTIVLNGSTMNVTSPDTPTGRPSGAVGSSPSNDSINQAGNLSPCMPTTSGGSVALPTNGVVFVENCLSGNSTCSSGTAYNPLSGDGETGATGPSYGDAIVNGSVTGPLTIGAQNNVVIDGNLCYTTGSTCSADSGQSGGPPSSSTDMLGLIAYNYVEVNHPLSGSNNAATCGGSHVAPSCDLSNPDINAAILALNHSFLVNNWASGSPLGSLTVNGSISEDWRGAVGTYSGSTVASGYLKAYSYDSRLKYFAPPYYLSPGTASWGIATYSVSGECSVSCTDP